MEKIESLVAPVIEARKINRTAIVYRKHVVVFNRWLGRIIPGSSVEFRIEIAPVEAAVKLIRTRPTDHRELCHLTIFGRVVGCHDFEFLVAFYIATWKAIRCLAAADYVVHRDAIGAKIISGIAHAVDHNSAATISSAVSTLHPGGYEHYIRPTTAVYALRELGKVLRGFDVRQRGGFGFKLTDISFHRHGGACFAQLQIRVHSFDLARIQNDSAAYKCLETRGAHTDTIISHPQPGDAVVPVFVGLHRPFNVGAFVLDGNRGSGYSSPGRVIYPPQNSALDSLSVGLNRHQ